VCCGKNEETFKAYSEDLFRSSLVAQFPFSECRVKESASATTDNQA